jgi:hypothetical protein
MTSSVIGTRPKVLQIIFEFNSNKSTYKDGFECLGTGLYNIWWFVFFLFLTPFTLGGHNFFKFISNFNRWITINDISITSWVQ